MRGADTMFTPGPQRLAAGGEDAYIRTAGQQGGGNRCSLGNNVLAVVKNQQERFVLQICQQGVEQRAIGHFLHAERRPDRRNHERRINQ